ncbi:hypothetical protein COU76_04140 [Candidatus Peregrinibacteria bacterium CG10_big_fil_rev_8_21_14_0_10_49_10]|nr:MAG: hypothetical protein COU76_04140 [Candidatus Peregrinibacteria bacterium CG10_big_fil_rev_8_21_14_0_10_49_10]
MNSNFSAKTSGKTGFGLKTGGTPFDQIALLEAQESARVALEIEAMEKEKVEVEQAIEEKEVTGGKEIREAALQELRDYRETELTVIVKTAEEQTEKETATVKKHYQEHEDAVVQKLVGHVVQKNFPLLQNT